MRDVIVVGGGPAGSAVAAMLAPDCDVLLLERDRFPREKLCGEFLSTESQAILERLGALDAVMATGPAPISSARFTAPSGRELTLSLPGVGLGITRRALDQILLEHARQRGAEVVDGVEVRSIQREGTTFRVDDHQARCVVGAWGRRARLDKTQQRPFTQNRHPYLAFKRHHRGDDTIAEALREHVEIHTVDGGYCGMSFVETGEINVCMLLERRFLDDLDDKSWPAIVGRLSEANGRLGARLARLTPSEEETHAVAEIPFEGKELERDGVLFVGDAAGMVAPLVGDGQAMALDSALLLARLIIQKEASGPKWTRTWHRAFGTRMRLARHLQERLLVPGRADTTIRWVKAVPGLSSLLARLTRG